ncbi:BON domain-containing protein [Phenylobacterium sp.]|uniref:BON domain-containing protein n=1 Tax=Phenylobacterium sp. TaxID=1871053 RepID=UPI0030F3784C
MADHSKGRNDREHWRGNPYGRDWDEAAADYQAGEEDRPGEGRSFDRGYVGPRYGAGGYTGYTGRGYTGGYGQNGTDPGERVSPYGDRVYRGDGGRHGGGRYDSAPRQDHPGEYRTYRDPGHRGLGPQGYTRSDQRINEDVHDRLTDDDHIDASGIVVAVQDGEVTLSGVIRDRRAKHHAEAIIEHIGGVKHVQNNLRVDASATTRAPAPMGENTVLRDQAEGKS